MADLIATPTHTRANSYLTLEELDELLLPYEWWQLLAPARKKNAAIIATGTLEGVPYAGQKLFIGQRLAFPRRRHPVTKINWPFLKYESDYSQIALTIEEATTSVSFYLDVFPDELMLIYWIGGDTHTATMADDGSISGPYLSGFCNKETAYVELTATQSFEVGSNISYVADGYSRFTFKSEYLRYDPEKSVDDFLKYGACRVIDETLSSLVTIKSNNVAAGEVTCSEGLSVKPSPNSKVMVIAPVPEDIKIAQVIQIVYQFRRDTYFPAEGIRSIRVGDTQVVFNERTSGYSKYVRMASRYGIHPAAFIRLVPYTIYGEAITIARQ